MNEEKDLVFHNENAVLQIARWSKFAGWVLAVIYLLRFISDLISVFSGGFQWPVPVMDRIMFVASMSYTLVIGAFYFLLMHGIAQVLYLGLDQFLKEEIE